MEGLVEHVIAAWLVVSYAVTVPLLVFGRRPVRGWLASLLASSTACSTIAMIGVTARKPIHIRGR